MDTKERIEKMLKKTEKILEAGRSKDLYLKPCPFCGTDDLHGVAIRNLWPFETYDVFCENCGASSKQFIMKEHAAEAWNKRVKNNG